MESYLTAHDGTDSRFDAIQLKPDDKTAADGTAISAIVDAINKKNQVRNTAQQRGPSTPEPEAPATEAPTAKQKAIAVANLSQLQWFVDSNEYNTNAFIIIPKNEVVSGLIAESLKILGINIEAGEDVFFSGAYLHDISGKLVTVDGNAPNLVVRKNALDQLIAAGVSTPTLDAYAGKTAAKVEHQGRLVTVKKLGEGIA